jgi:threonine dehydrogenase-like Zn-dependent dehydrogenase
MADQTGKLAFLADPKNVEIREYDIPSPEPGAVLTTVERANVCGSELHIWRGNHPEVEEGVLGHEALCRVEELGDSVETDYADEPIEEGDLVAPVYYLTCQRCSACQRDEFNLCENAYEYWSKPPEEPPHFHGTFGTHYFLHPEQYFYKVPDPLDRNIAAGANCALSQVMYGMDQVGVGYGDSVVVQGAGGLGLNAIAVANERGADTIVIEGVDGRLERAEEFHVDHTIDFREYDTVEARADRVAELTGGGADVGIEVAGVPDAFAEGIHLVRKGGAYLEMGNVSPGHMTDFDPGLLTRRNLTVESVVRYQPWYLRKALAFLEEHADDYPYHQLIDTEFDLVDVTEALERSGNREVTRATLIPEHAD